MVVLYLPAVKVKAVGVVPLYLVMEVELFWVVVLELVAAMEVVPLSLVMEVEVFWVAVLLLVVVAFCQLEGVAMHFAPISSINHCNLPPPGSLHHCAYPVLCVVILPIGQTQ